MILTNRKRFPKCVRPIQEVKGICVGECIHKMAFGVDWAHAHAHPSDGHVGWICCRSKKYFTATTLLHETAHILADKEKLLKASHSSLWARIYKKTHNRLF